MQIHVCNFISFQYASSTGYNCVVCPAGAKYNNATRTCGACDNPAGNFTVFEFIIMTYFGVHVDEETYPSLLVYIHSALDKDLMQRVIYPLLINGKGQCLSAHLQCLTLKAKCSIQTPENAKLYYI